MCPHIRLKERSQIRNVMLQKMETQTRKHIIYIHSLEDRNCDVCLRNKITRVLCRRRNEGSILRAEKFGDFIKADQRKWIPEQSPVRCRGTRSCHSMDTILSVWEQQFAGDGEESTKVSRAVTEAKSFPISARDQSRLHQFGKKLLPGTHPGHVPTAREPGKETFWLHCIYRHHFEPRVQLYVPKEESFRFHRKQWCHQVNSHRFGRSTRKTNWWLLECRRRQKSVRFLDGLHEIHIIERNSSKTTSSPDHMWLDAWTRIGKANQRKAKQEWVIEKPKIRTRQNIESNLFYWS